MIARPIDARVGNDVDGAARGSGLVVAVAGVLLLAAMAVAGFGLFATLAEPPGAPSSVVLRVAERIAPDGTHAVTLPDRLDAPDDGDAPARASYRLRAELGARPTHLALYLPGLLGHARIRVNGHLLVDEAVEPVPPAPRGSDRLRLYELPEALLHAGENEWQLDVVGRRGLSVSEAWVGPREALAAMHDRKAAALVTGPVIVATVMGCLGFCMLALAVRRQGEGLYGPFGAGAVCWSLHTFWTVLPHPLLPAPHEGLWWNVLYATWVTLMVTFALRFASHRRASIERALRIFLVAVPCGLYAALAVGQLSLAATSMRLVLVAMAFATFGLVARHAWRERSAASALLFLAGAACAGLGLRDWLVFLVRTDNLPIALTPYAGLPFIVMVSWILIDRFVRTTEAVQTLNRDLEMRVAEREAELADKYRHLARLEGEQAATDERQRIMRDLHDGLGSQLFTSLSRVERRAIDHDGMAQVLRGCIAEMRLALEAMASDERDLATTLGNFLFRWELVLREAGIVPAWRIDVPEGEPALAPHDVLQLLRVLQEALTNALRHARASKVQVALIEQPGGALSLSIEDDGVGLPESPGAQGGRGLANLRSRARALGATLALDSHPGRTRIALSIPPRRDRGAPIARTRDGATPSRDSAD